MRQIVQGTPKTTPTPRNVKFLIIRGRKAETVYFPETMTADAVKALLVTRQDATEADRVIRG